MRKINFISIIIGVIGFFVSLYALILHIQILMRPGRGALCDINTTFNCSNVIGSSYGELAAIPLGSYGMTYFTILIAAAILPKFSAMTKKQHIHLELFLGSIGFIIVACLFYISHSILKIMCPVCTAIHILVSFYFILKLISFIKNRNLQNVPASQSSDYMLRFLAISICLGLPPLAVGLITPIVVEKFTPSPNATGVKNSASLASPSAIESLISQLMTFNKNNYVGSGEDYRRGSDDAKIIVQMFSDFGCPHCRQASNAISQAQDRVGLDKVLFIYRFFPLSNKCNSSVPSEGWYPYSCSLSFASRCAGAQGKFWEFKDWAFLGQDWSDELRAQNFSMAGMKEKAKNLGINSDQFEQCIITGIESNKIKEDIELANKVKIKGTPLIFINGKEYKGNHTADEFTRAFQSL